VEKASWEKLIDNLVKQGHLRTPSVIRSMRGVPRAKFVPALMQTYSANDTPIQIGFGQSILAPQIVAIMIEALMLDLGSKVLEVGAGSGWLAATIAEIVAPREAPRSEWGHVYTLEIVGALARSAKKNIMNAGYGDCVSLINSDGSKGYPQKAPYDRIIVTASAPIIPKPLVDQLKESGVLLIPVGAPMLFQKLMKLTKLPKGEVKEETLGNVSFGPLISEVSKKP
jgi:protein-L-isoaspartate(D-aspartate) O-methyltransferase